MKNINFEELLKTIYAEGKSYVGFRALQEDEVKDPPKVGDYLRCSWEWDTFNDRSCYEIYLEEEELRAKGEFDASEREYLPAEPLTGTAATGGEGLDDFDDDDKNIETLKKWFKTNQELYGWDNSPIVLIAGDHSGGMDCYHKYDVPISDAKVIAIVK